VKDLRGAGGPREDQLGWENDLVDTDTVEIFLSRTTLRQVEVIVALRQYGSMTIAAEALGMSVANVSRMSKRFENNLGVRIFAGDKRRSVILADAHKIIDCLVPLLAEITSVKAGLRNLLGSLQEPG
jgi:DNA-binding transcriptional LysR family regulator